MISLILPYWCRQDATDKALRLMAGLYRGLDLEVIVVDDGSPEPFEALPLDLDIRVVRLPRKDGPLNPCVPYNRGFEVSRGEFIALSNPETLHREPVLEKMRAGLEPKSYVMAAAWCPEQRRWHCHGSRDRSNDNDVGIYLPAGSDYHFMTMMHRSLWPGFDEDYRLGAGYDDPDFVRRLHEKGAKFVRRDDLIVEHPRQGAHAQWTPSMFARNRAIFLSKWRPLDDCGIAA